MTRLAPKKVLLVHPLGYLAEASGRDISRLANLMPPLGLASIASFLERKGLTAEIVDGFAHPQPDSLLVDRLLSESPAFIGFSTTTSSFLDGVRQAALAKEVLPGVQTVFGGAHVAALKEKILARFPAVDFVVTGEGEETLLELVQSGGCGGARTVRGLVYRDGETPVFSGPRASQLDLDSLPFPAYEKLSGYPQAYQLPIFNYPTAPNTSCISSRGCPYACSYCDRSVFGRSFRYNSAEYLYDHVRYLNTRFGIRHLNFYDDQFTFQRKRVETFTRLMREKPLGVTYNCAVRAEHIDAPLLKEMKASGCWMISLGVETGDPDLLAQHRQRADLGLLGDKLRLIKGAGIRTKGLLMMGLPGESEKSIRLSMEFVANNPIDDFNLSKFTPFPGTPLYETVKRSGRFEEEWPKMDCLHFQFIPEGMTRERLEVLFQEFYKRHYMRPKTLWNFVTMLWRSPDSWRRFLSNLPQFLRFARTSRRLSSDAS